MTAVHRLKIWPSNFAEVLSGHRTFELRENDRDYKCGDFVLLQEYDWTILTDDDRERYSGRETMRRIASILFDHPGLSEGYVILGLVPT